MPPKAKPKAKAAAGGDEDALENFQKIWQKNAKAYDCSKMIDVEAKIEKIQADGRDMGIEKIQADGRGNER